MSIGTKLLLFTFLFTIIPLFITATLIIHTYQDLMNTLLAEEGIEINEKIMEGLTEALRNARIQAILTVFIVIILTVFGNILTSRNLTRPLGELVKGTKQVAKGNLEFKINIETKDELGELAGLFNNMTEELKEMKVSLEEAKQGLEKEVESRTKELKATAEALEESKTTLEIKVRARTQELKDLNENLDEQIRERTKELEKKVQELQKFREIAVGRELKMVELKKEIKKLKEKSKSQKPS